MQADTELSLSPSFNSYSSDRLAKIAAQVCEEEFPSESKSSASGLKTEEESVSERSSEHQFQDLQLEDQQNVKKEEGEKDNDDFEFAFVCRDPEGSPISADEIFYNGQIRPIFPIFNRDLLFAGGRDDDSNPPNVSPHRLPLRKLLFQEREQPTSSSSSEADDLEGVPAGTYCVWKPKAVPGSPERCKKSNSTGSSKRWRLRHLLNRSNSDGKDAYVFLTPSGSGKTKTRTGAAKTEKSEPAKETKNSGEVKIPGKLKEKGNNGEAVSAHEIHYVRNRALKEGDKRKSFLPYRQDIVGFFANVNVLSRNLHPPF